MNHSEHEINQTPNEIVAGRDENLIEDTNTVTITPLKDTPAPKQDTVYHAANTYLGETYTFDEGGHYELIIDNALVYHTDNEQLPAANNTPQLAGSYSPAACIIARIHERNNVSGAIGQHTQQVTLYELTQNPDVDLQECPDRDFKLLEEVRYNNPSENPVDGHHYMTILLPARVSLHIEQLYNPDKDIAGTYTPDNDGWCSTKYGNAVKQAINTYLETGRYPDPETFINTSSEH